MAAGTRMKALAILSAVSALRAAASVASSISLSSNQIERILQNDAAEYNRLDDLTGYSLSFSHCVRVKIPNEQDDDAAEGNVNFYNGRYHAQYQIHATFHVCGNGNYADDTCSACDYNVEYTTDVNTYLETGLNYYEEMCEECQNACGGGDRRLEDEDGQVDCNTCSNACAAYYQGDNGGNDESMYMDCQAGFEEDDVQYYYGPQCSDNGNIIIGVFYDDECTIKTKHDSPDFDYYRFEMLTKGCFDCSVTDDAAETCNQLYGDSYHCLNGIDQQGQDNEMSVCSTVKKALMNVDYSNVKKRHSGADLFVKVFLVLLLVSFVCGSLFLAYTYFLRHRGEKAQPMLSSEDIHEEEPQPLAGEGGTHA